MKEEEMVEEEDKEKERKFQFQALMLLATWGFISIQTLQSKAIFKKSLNFFSFSTEKYRKDTGPNWFRYISYAIPYP